MLDSRKIKEEVRRGYAKIAMEGSSCCGVSKSCCGNTDLADNISKKIGYDKDELKLVPDGANLGLGCGNPIAFSSLKEGEVVLDLGSGAGFDCFLAANKVGQKGKVIGVDMTPEMIDKARNNAIKGNYENVEFRLGEIENLPVADNTVDVIISNCVINLSSDKRRVFTEAFRVLKPGGRMIVSDIVLLKKLPKEIQCSINAYIGCLSGALMREEYIEIIKRAGFKNVKIIDEIYMSVDCIANDPTVKVITEQYNLSQETIREVEKTVLSIKVYGEKDARKSFSSMPK